MTSGNFEEFWKWIIALPMYQFDIETNVTNFWDTRVLISLQFGSCGQGPRTQWFLQWSALNSSQRKAIKLLLEDPHQTKLIHNAAYEYVMMRFYGIIIENVYDTMLAEKIINGGLEIENYALADISWKYLRIVMDKTLQKEFGDDVITVDKIIYGVTDVAYLDIIRRQQLDRLAKENLMNVASLEMDAVLPFSDITYEGMYLDKEKWRENERLAIPLVEAALTKVNSWLQALEFESYAYDKGYISNKDRITINPNSVQQKQELLQLILPDIIGTSQPLLKRYLDEHPCTLDPDVVEVLKGLLIKHYQPFYDYLVHYHRDYLVEQQYLIPAYTATINWNSQQQVLPLMQLVEPRLKDLSEESRNKCTHPALKDMEKYKQALKLVNDLGENYINKYVSSDGKVRTNWNQIVSTGRCSSSRPNMQNITVDELVGTRYRNAFVCEEGWEFVDSDYISQELVIIAFVSKDPVWMEAINNGWDLHSICAELVHGKKWKDAADTGCDYYKMVVESSSGRLVAAKQKCSCKKHKQLRNGIKTINFG